MSGLSVELVPFAQLPECARKCGPLWDANGACVPPVAPVTDEATYLRCFCGYATLQPFRQGPTGVCPAANCDEAGYSSIQSWFTSACNIGNSAPQPTNSASGRPGSGSSGNQGGGGDWLSNHWQYVIMLVIIAVGIAGIWIGACIWRRRYLKRKDRAYELGKHSGSSGAAHSSWGPNGGASHAPTTSNVSGPGVFMPNNSPPAAAMYDEKSRPKKERENKKWVVKERT